MTVVRLSSAWTGSVASLAALRWAADQAAYRQVPLRVVHALAVAATPYPDFLASVGPAIGDHANDVLADALAKGLRGASHLCVSSEVVVDSSAARALLLESTTSQLLVVGARRSRRLRRASSRFCRRPVRPLFGLPRRRRPPVPITTSIPITTNARGACRHRWSSPGTGMPGSSGKVRRGGSIGCSIG
ncbi:universal stress protein [Candidatus Protofrankia californiensis]|uniref:universal stress protein n=1 Tax=Candidatus Protofrankia californiensis TaxID=1839754 RepID=UPI003D3352EF